MTSPAAKRLRDDKALWSSADSAIATARTATLARVRLGFRLELAGIVIVLGLMAVLAFATR